MSDVLEIESIRRLDVKPGETLLVTLPDSTTPAAFEGIADALRAKLPEGLKLLIACGAVEFSVVSAQTS